MQINYTFNILHKKFFLFCAIFQEKSLAFSYTGAIIESTNNKAPPTERKKAMMTINLYTAKDVYTEMLNTEPLLLTSAKSLSYADQMEIEKDYRENKKWIEKNDPDLSKENAMYFVAYDWSITIGVIKYLLAII